MTFGSVMLIPAPPTPSPLLLAANCVPLCPSSGSTELGRYPASVDPMSGLNAFATLLTHVGSR